jgi:hypothetical protein
MKIAALIVTAVLLLGGCSVSFNNGAANEATSTPGTAAQQKVVTAAAVAFLKQLDAGLVENTWATASSVLRSATSQDTWVTGIGAFRSTVGAFKSRKLKGIGFTNTVSGAPAGEYAAVAFDSAFSNATVEEKVVIRKENGQWRVVGYFMSKKFSVGGQSGDL